ncbi:uncharacterized protein LOC6569107 [Drosophila grimshawi]|uniref:GH22730 n=1 Tax=Drosophila grimshawi TaxID=7222 RepID=B4JWI5_DROGR|nr:uncharacterized protein LOC6569107 [Drosophila grimshawi]EDV98323.1 GH22730 [Drosophila grimshawi]
MGHLDYQRKLEEFQSALDVPKWYAGLSDYQEEAIKELCNDLRDDFEQGTSFRVEKILMRLGLSPMISKKKIRTMVQLSRGNDLAFLFFILDGYYVSCRKNGEYTTNEKLLMIAMAKIDLLPTLRELDRILPPPQLSELELRRQRGSTTIPGNSKPQLEQQATQPKKTNKGTKSPYFQRQPRPKEIVVKYTSKPPQMIAKFPFWPLDQPPNYGKPTDPPWFADYNLNPVNRLVKKTVGEAVDKYFNHLNHMKQLESKARISRRAALALQKAMKEDTDEPQFCAYHRFAVGEAQLVKDELVVLARDRCIELMDVTLPYRKLRQRRILAQLEHDVDCCMKRYAMKMESATVHTITRKFDCVICQEQRVDLPVAKPHERKGRALVGDCLNLAHTEATEKCVGERLTGGGLHRQPIDFRGELGTCKKVTDFDAVYYEPDPSSCLAHKGKNQQRISFLIDDSKMKRLRKNRKDPAVEVRYQGKQTKKTFFTAPGDHKPYQFKYKRIFRTGLEKPRDVKKFIDRAFVNALDKGDAAPKPSCEKPSEITSDEDVGQLEMEVSGLRLTDSCASSDDSSEHSQRSHEDRRAEIVDAVVRCAKDIWMRGVNMKRAEMEAAEQNEQHPETEARNLTFAVDRIDPDNAELMSRMLQEGMQELRKNRRFVLASLPEAHKLPVLQEWIKRRYGKLYTEEEIQKSIQDSLKVFEMIILLQNRPPTADLMGMDQLPPHKETFAYYSHAKALASKVKAEYYKKLNDMYMNHTIACWYAMGNYLCRGGPPKKTFYAYMSANTRDIMRNKVWNGEYRNIRRLRDIYRETHKK